MKKLLFIVGSLSLLFFTACKKELSDNFTTYTSHPLNDTTWAKNVSGSASVHKLAELLKPQIVIDSFDIARDTVLKYGDSLELSFTAGSCVDNNGTVPTGKIKLELLRLKKKADYIKTFKATTGNGYLLETGGAFFIRLSKDEKELVLAPGAYIKIRFSDTEDPKNTMQTFYGKVSNPPPAMGIDTSFTWYRDADTTWLTTFQQSGQGTGAGIKGYELIAKKTGWVAAERFTDSTRPKTKITAILPLNFTNKNTAVFAVFAEQKTVVNLRGDYPSRSFAAVNIPIGTKLTIVTISRIGEALYLGTKEVNDTGNIAAYSVKPEKKSLKDILQFLNN